MEEVLTQGRHRRAPLPAVAPRKSLPLFSSLLLREAPEYARLQQVSPPGDWRAANASPLTFERSTGSEQRH